MATHAILFQICMGRYAGLDVEPMTAHCRESEQVGNRIMDGNEPLKLACRLEAFHDPFASSGRLVRIFRSIIQACVRPVFDAGHEVAHGGIIGSELVGDHDPWCPPLSFQQLAHQTLCRLGISAALYQHFEDEAVLIDGTPEPLLLATDSHDTFVEMPFIAQAAG